MVLDGGGTDENEGVVQRAFEGKGYLDGESVDGIWQGSSIGSHPSDIRSWITCSITGQDSSPSLLDIHRLCCLTLDDSGWNCRREIRIKFIIKPRYQQPMNIHWNIAVSKSGQSIIWWNCQCLKHMTASFLYEDFKDWNWRVQTNILRNNVDVHKVHWCLCKLSSVHESVDVTHTGLACVLVIFLCYRYIKWQDASTSFDRSGHVLSK